MAPFFNRMSTTLEWPYWEATVRAVPPSCHKTQHIEDNVFSLKRCITQQNTMCIIASLLHKADPVWDESVLTFSITACALQTTVHVSSDYLCLEFCGGTKFKKELHDVMMSLLGGEEQSRRTRLEGPIKTKKDSAVYFSDFNPDVEHSLLSFNTFFMSFFLKLLQTFTGFPMSSRCRVVHWPIF